MKPSVDGTKLHLVTSLPSLDKQSPVKSHYHWLLISGWVWFEPWACRGWLQGYMCEAWGLGLCKFNASL